MFVCKFVRACPRPRMCRMIFSSLRARTIRVILERAPREITLRCRTTQVIEITTSKTGKHGHAKANITGLDIFTGNKYQDMSPTSHTMCVREQPPRVRVLAARASVGRAGVGDPSPPPRRAQRGGGERIFHGAPPPPPFAPRVRAAAAAAQVRARR